MIFVREYYLEVGVGLRQRPDAKKCVAFKSGCGVTFPATSISHPKRQRGGGGNGSEGVVAQGVERESPFLSLSLPLHF